MSEFYGDSDSHVSNEPIHILKEGMNLPKVTFKTRVRVESSDENPFEWKPLDSKPTMREFLLTFSFPLVSLSTFIQRSCETGVASIRSKK